jgi:predicted dehydrogenase
LKKVILEGCNGDWAHQKRYLPILLGKATQGDIELLAIDIESDIKLSDPMTEKNWEAAGGQKARYIRKVDNTLVSNKLPKADYVFIVTPDNVHCEIASFWLERLTPEGKIFIEKPLDASLVSASELKKKITKKETVFAFDHYRARSYPFLKNKDKYLKMIGKVNQIKFHILEDEMVPAARAKALDKGMIFDLFCHGLAVLFALKEPTKVELKEVKAARYAGSPISGDTFAWIRFVMNNKIQVDSAIGKCVGTSKDKFMSIVGSSGEIFLDFQNDKFIVKDLKSKVIEHGDLN